ARRAAGRKAHAVLAGKLSALDPTAVLSRGYAIAAHRDSGRVVRSVAEVVPGERLDVRVSDGTFGALVEGGRR
ncbi:MAG: exodeoxyribonuclease VII large subunit, partial [Gemmatimonadota bacterium]